MPASDDLPALLAGCARQDRRAFERLYQLTAPKLFALCVSILRREALAEEVLQEAFVQIWRNAVRFDPQRGTPMTWMAVIARHLALDRLRRQRPEAPLDEEFESQPDSGPGPLEDLLHQSDQTDLRRCLEQLSDAQRESILLAFFRGLTHQQLSQALATPLGTVKSWIRRGLEQLKRCLQP